MKALFVAVAACFAFAASSASAQETVANVSASFQSPTQLVQVQAHDGSFGTLGIPNAGRSCVYTIANSEVTAAPPGVITVTDGAGAATPSATCVATGAVSVPHFVLTCPTTINVSSTATITSADVPGVELGDTTLAGGAFRTPGGGTSAQTCTPGGIDFYPLDLAVRVGSAPAPPVAASLVVGTLALQVSF